MAKNLKPQEQISAKAKLIFNPHAGTKRKILSSPNTPSLEDIKQLLQQYQIPVDYFPTKKPGHATELARDSIREGYKTVLIAGGDGTVGEAANGLIGSNIPLGILPLGSFMNIARMLSIPLDLEKAVLLIKAGRVRKIDLGSVTKLSGETLEKPSFFIESCGLGMEAELHQHFLNLERGNLREIFSIFKTFFSYYNNPTKLTLDNEVIHTRAILINISNGPYSGALIPWAPRAKLNDHLLTVTQFKLSRVELIRYFFRLITGRKKGFYHRVITSQAKRVRIETRIERAVHADARLYGTTPVDLKIFPNALNVISGFPKRGEKTALIKRTYLDP